LFFGVKMTKLGEVKVIYLADGKKKSAGGQGEDMGAFVKIRLNPSKRRTKFNTVLIPWANVVKVIVLE